jgi:selenide,water dikinase
VGFSVTGLLDGAPVTRSGAKPGDVLVLTRPIGSGTILAGEMALAAPGDAVAAALQEMARPQIAAARALSRAHAMTDVTGFGLAGHLIGICRDSGVSATVSLEALPFYDGALALAAQGIRSTLYPANEDSARPWMTLPNDPRVPLLFDPQTAGGLLAALPEAEATEALRILLENGVPAARIGSVTDGPPHLTVTG